MPELGVLAPYDASPLTILVFVLAAASYGYALPRLPRNQRPGALRVLAFGLGLLLCYGVMQTRFDYYAQYMFFGHRGQHRNGPR